MGKIIILDPAPAPGRLPDELMENIDYIKPNVHELAKLTGIANIRENLELVCDKLLAQGVMCVLASLGPDGVMVKEQGGAQGRLYGAEAVKAVDMTGAGDSFIAAAAYALANGCDIDQAVRFANRVAAIAVQRLGAQASIPTQEEIRTIWKDELCM